MRFIHTSDWHLGKTLDRYSRIEEQKKFCHDFIERVNEENIDMIIIAGDIIDYTNNSSEGEELFYSTVSKISNNGQRCVLIVKGDKDNLKKLSSISSLVHKQGILIVDKLNTKIEPIKYSGFEVTNSNEGSIKLNIKGEKIVIATLPYCSESELDRFISKHDDKYEKQQSYSSKVSKVFNILENYYEDNSINIAVSHVSVAGGENNNLTNRSLENSSVEKRDLPQKSQYIALGHLHKMQKISERINAYYSGSPLQYSKYEREDSKGGYLVEINNNNKPIVEELYFDNYRPIELFTCNEISRALEICEENKNRDIWSYFEIKTSKAISSQNIKKMKETLKGIVEIMPLNKDNLSEECNIDKSMAELFKSFYYYNNESEVSGELMNLFLEISSKEGETNHETN